VAVITFFLLLQQWFSTVSLKGAKSILAILLESRTKNFTTSQLTFCFIALTKSVTQNITGVTERHCLSKGILFQQRLRH